MAGKVKTWVWVVIGIVAVCILGVVAMAGVGFYFITQHIDSKTASAADAAKEFEAVKGTFPGQTPLIELDRSGRFLRAHTDRPAPGSATVPDQLYLLAFDTNERRIVRFNIPFWLLRMKSRNATIDLNGNRMDLEDLRLTVEDLERYGPSVIVDHRSPDGDRIMVWSR